MRYWLDTANRIMIFEQWMFWLTAVVFTGMGFYWGRERTIYIDVSQITESVIDQLEALGFIHKIINEDGEEELVPHPEAIKTDD